ncbi:putative thioredoxin-dependent peroxiredoxin [Helianthus annuus]|nr:putative thioredoxin-dependent peroxiredoxin [Helianthus annuus]
MAPIKVGDTKDDGFLAGGERVNGDLLHLIFLVEVCKSSVKNAVTRLIEKSEELKSKGVEEFLLISVNDPFVMKAWKKSYPETKKCEVLSRRVCNIRPCPWYELDLICKVKVGKGSLSFK